MIVGSQLVAGCFFWLEVVTSGYNKDQSWDIFCLQNLNDLDVNVRFMIHRFAVDMKIGGQR